MGPPTARRGAIWAWVCALALVAAVVAMWRLRVPDMAATQGLDRDPGASTTPAGTGQPVAAEPADEGSARDAGPGETQVATSPTETLASTPVAGPASPDGGTRPNVAPAKGGARANANTRSPWAIVDGRAEVDGIPPENPRIDHASDPRCVMPSNARDEVLKVQDGRLENVALQLVAVDAKPPPKTSWRSPSGFLNDQPAQPRNVTLVEHGCELVPRVSAVTTGARIEIINHDYTRHELKLIRDGQTIAQGEVQPREKVKELAADGPGLVEVRCARHPWEHAFVLIAPSGARTAVTHSSGKFRVDSLAPGKWALKAWHERFGWQSRELDLQPGEVLSSPLQYSLPVPPQVQLSTMPR